MYMIIVFLLLIASIALIFSILALTKKKSGKVVPGSSSIPRPSKPPKKSKQVRNEQGTLLESYFAILYPVTDFSIFTNDQIKSLYTSLNWYYAPLPMDIGVQSIILPYLDGNKNTDQKPSIYSRRAPLFEGAYVNAVTEAFLSDGQDQVVFTETVAEDDDWNASADCVGSTAGYGGIMPNDKYYMPVNEDTGEEVGDWWPQYTDPNPQLLIDNPTVSGQPPGADCAGGRASDCGWCDSGTLCVDSGVGKYPKQCYLGAANAFASVFGTNVTLAPLWEAGSLPCTPDQLNFKDNTLSSSCIKNLMSVPADATDLPWNPDLTEMKKNAKHSTKFQMVNVIEPYGRRNGCPNFGFIESVAYVLEGLGKKLLTAPDCVSGENPISVGALSRVSWCPNNKNFSHLLCDPGDFDACKTSVETWKKEKAKIEHFSQTSTKPASSVSHDECPAHGCCFSSSGNVLKDNTLGANTLDKSKFDAFDIAKEGDICVQNQNLGKNCTGGDTMFYWLKGYGKFLNMGLTGIYPSYISMFLTCPNNPWNCTNPDDGPFLRRTPEQLTSMGMGAGALTQLKIFTGESDYKDRKDA